MKKDEFHRCGLLTLTVVSTFFFVGAIFGWGPMQLLLEEAGIFGCSSSAEATGGGGGQEEEEVCQTQQTTKLIQVNFVASATQVTAPVWGYVLDRYGPFPTFGVLVTFVISGILLLLITLKFALSDHLIYGGFILLALGSWCGGLLMVPTGLYFQGKMRNRVIIVLNALFDSSAMTYWILWSLAEYAGLELMGVLAVYLGIAVLLFVPGLYFWYVAVPEEIKKEEEENEEENVSLPMDETETSRRQRQERAEGNTHFSEEHTTMTVTMIPSKPLSPTTATTDPPEQDYVLVALRSPTQQLMAYPTVLLLIFFGIQVGINLWTLTTTRDFLAHLGDDALDNRYLSIFTLLTPVSLVGTPAVDWALRKFGYPGAFQFINLLSLGSMVIRVSSTNLNVQILGFVLFSFYRSFFFGVTFSYLPTLLSADMVGRMSGLLYMISGIASFLNIPMARLAIQRHDGDFFITNMIYTALIAPCVVAAWGMRRADRLEQRWKQPKVKSES
ncbi:hypothetical protein FisN_32Hh012 [Fistulifera solaris]|uniref:Major facilitator superfamily (MFS) profile domain-containing protein n=1 Tax=Fistulifera solaris TaxID=1519565 RepID=A0A1Z5J5U7_FISSO|nr:hypothetical protein FisN_32Hh012 [Fistulifera solaris]|eukprot:GAX09316.1 hypothetical protein FisN_32Hh012 [Fistulifera solaris]